MRLAMLHRLGYIDTAPYYPGYVNGYGGFGSVEVVPNVTFQNDHAAQDFLRGLTLRGAAGVWPGVPQAIVDSLRGAISQVSGPRGQTAVVQFAKTAQNLTAQIDGLQTWSGLSGRSEEQDAAFKNAMSALRTLMEAYTATITSANKQDLDAATAAAVTQEAQKPKLPVTPGSAALTASGGGDGIGTILMIAVPAVLALGAASYLLLRKKKPAAVAGYHRKSRRKRRR